MELVRPESVGLSSERLARIEEHLERRYLAPKKIAGALTLVARRGQLAPLKALGSMDLERGVAMREDTIFRIYSMTKPITSVGLMMLYEQGRFQLDDPVHRFISSWKDLAVFAGGNHPVWKTEPAARPMTVRDLLTHTSGLTYGFIPQSLGPLSHPGRIKRRSRRSRGRRHGAPGRRRATAGGRSAFRLLIAGFSA